MRRAFSRKNLWENAPAGVRRIAGGLLSRVPPAIVLGPDFRRNLRGVLAAERWPQERIRAYQVGQLRRICRLAIGAPYYRESFRTAGFAPDDLYRVEDLAGLPTIDKHVVTNRLAELCAQPIDRGGVDFVSTGGTSGNPLRFYMPSSRSAPEFAHLVAGWQRIGYRLQTPQVVLRGKVVAENRDGLRHEYDPLLRRHYYSNFHMSDDAMARYLDHVATIGPCFLHVYPSSIQALARFLERAGRPAPANIRGILAGSEQVYPVQRGLAERVFGVRYYSWYGHSEKLVLAGECEHSTDYHVWPTYGFCELLDDEGRAVTQPGQSGEIVGTGFINTVMPFIRYRTGDYATYVGDHCPGCGRAHVLIRDIVGHRTHEFLVAADGSQISWTALNMHDDTFDRVRQFQFYQVRCGQAVLRMVPDDDYEHADAARIMHHLNQKLDGRVTFTIRLMNEIPLSPRGKAVYVDQRIAPQGPAPEACRPPLSEPVSA